MSRLFEFTVISAIFVVALVLVRHNYATRGVASVTFATYAALIELGTHVPSRHGSRQISYHMIMISIMQYVYPEFRDPTAITQIDAGHVQQFADLREDLRLSALSVRLVIGIVRQSGYSDYTM